MTGRVGFSNCRMKRGVRRSIFILKSSIEWKEYASNSRHSLAKSLKEAMFAWGLAELTTIQAASLHEWPNFGNAGSVDRRMMAPSPLVTGEQALSTKND